MWPIDIPWEKIMRFLTKMTSLRSTDLPPLAERFLLHFSFNRIGSLFDWYVILLIQTHLLMTILDVRAKPPFYATFSIFRLQKSCCELYSLTLVGALRHVKGGSFHYRDLPSTTHS